MSIFQTTIKILGYVTLPRDLTAVVLTEQSSERYRCSFSLVKKLG